MGNTICVGWFFECNNPLFGREEEIKVCKIHGIKRGCKFCPDCGSKIEKIKTGRTIQEQKFDSSKLETTYDTTQYESPFWWYNGTEEEGKDLFVLNKYCYIFANGDCDNEIHTLDFETAKKDGEEAERNFSDLIEDLKEIYGDDNVKLKYGVISIDE